MEAKENKNIANLEVKSAVNSINFYTPNNGTLSKICFCHIKKSGVAVRDWIYIYATGIEIGTTTELGMTTGVYAYVNEEKYVEIELYANVIPSKYNCAAFGTKAREQAIKKFKKQKQRAGQTLLMDLPTTCFVREKDINFITSTGIVYDRIDTFPIDRLIPKDVKLTDTFNSIWNDGSGTTTEEESKTNTTTLLALGVLALKLLS